MSAFNILDIITNSFLLDLYIGIITKEITWSVMITTADLMIAFSNLIGETNSSIFINISNKTSRSLTTRASNLAS